MRKFVNATVATPCLHHSAEPQLWAGCCKGVRDEGTQEQMSSEENRWTENMDREEVKEEEEE